MVSGKYDLNDNLNDNWADHRERERETAQYHLIIND